MKRSFNLTNQEIIELYNNNKTLDEIAALNNSTRYVVTQIIKNAGLEIRKSGEARKSRPKGFMTVSYEELYNLYVEQKLSTLKIGEMYGVSSYTVNKRLKELNIPIRTMAESKFKGEKRLDKKGYVIISYYDEEGNYCRQHEHRYVMEKHLGRKLTPDEDVHHVDFDKTNNDISNLRVLSHTEHTELHYNIQKLERINWMIDYVKTNKRYPKHEEMPFDRDTLRVDWGSMKEAYEVVCAETGIEYMHPCEKTTEECLRIMYDFEIKTGAAPRMKDFKAFTVGVKWDTVRRRFDSASDVWSAYEAYKKSKRNI